MYLGYVPSANIFYATEVYDTYTIDYTYWLDINELYYVKYNNDDLIKSDKIITSFDNYIEYKYFIDNYYNVYLK